MAIAAGIIDANGTYTATVVAGRDYVVCVSDDYGGGTLVVNAVDSGANAILIENATFLSSSEPSLYFTAPKNDLQFVLSGATAPNLEVTLCEAQGAPPFTQTGRFVTIS